MKEIIGDFCHEQLVEQTIQKLAFREDVDFCSWKQSIRDKLIELLGIHEIEKNSCPLQLKIEKDEQKDGYRQIRFVFESEKGAWVPCYLLVPDTKQEKIPVVITLQGHSSGFHNSIAEPKNESEMDYAMGRGAFAVQAVKNGYAALAIEQRAMGERTSSRHPFQPWMCTFATLTAFQLGRTTIGERIWDVQRAIDLLPNFSQIDTDKIVLTGNSGGGTATYYISCLEERVKIVAPSCSFCPYKDSILNVHHCPCNHIPNAYRWFEMQDLACLIAPRSLIIIAGKDDKIFPIDGVLKGFETVQKIYKKAGQEKRCQLVTTPKAHWWCEDIVWDAINQETKILGWI